VTSISVKVGDVVTLGQELARVDPTDAQAALNTAKANRTAANASLTRARATADDATIATAQAQVTSANAAVDAAQRTLDGTVLKAPMAGTVTAVNGSVGGSSGGSGGNGNNGSNGGSSGFIALADLSQMQVSASFAEADATKLKAAQAATVTWAALSGATANGTVATIAPTASTSNNVNSYAVTVALTSLPEGIRIGQTVTVTVTVASVENAVRVPTAAVRSVGGRHQVTVVTNGTSEVRTVEVGVQGDTFVQITSGLSAGEQVEIVITTTGGTNNNNGGQFPGGGRFINPGTGGGGGIGNFTGGGNGRGNG
jgi:macrolide-specific efflux system membrane fusion protein